MKNLILTSTVVLTLAVSPILLQSCTDTKGNNNSIPKGAEPIPVKVIALDKSAGTSVVIASGQLTTDDETILSFKIGGVVNAVLVKEGDAVKKGQLLATLDLTEVNAQVAQARHNYEKAQRDFQRITNLYRDSVATLEQLQNSQTGMAIAKEQLDAASFNRSFSEIHATADGYILKKFVNGGQVVSTGNAVLQTNGAGKGKWILKAGVSDKQWSAININDKATLRIDAFPDRTFDAVVRRKSETSDSQTGAFTVELQIKNEDVKLATGMFGSAELKSDKVGDSWSIPYEAVLDANGADGFVFITNDAKTAVKQPVMIQSFNDKTIRISKGLEDAKSLIISGSAYLTDHSPITIVK